LTKNRNRWNKEQKKKKCSPVLLAFPRSRNGGAREPLGRGRGRPIRPGVSPKKGGVVVPTSSQDAQKVGEAVALGEGKKSKTAAFKKKRSRNICIRRKKSQPLGKKKK